MSSRHVRRGFLRGSVITMVALSCLFQVLSGCDGGGSDRNDKKGESTYLYRSQLSEEDQQRVVAVVEGVPITLAEFERRLNSQAQTARARYSTLESKKEFLRNMVRFEALAVEAERRGYDEHPQVLLEKKQHMVRLMMRDVALEVRVSDIPEAEIEAYYQAHYSEYHRPERIRVSHILLPTEEEAWKVYKEIVAAIEEKPIRARQIFESHARKYSTDEETAEKGGDVGYFARTEEGGTVEAEITKRAFELYDFGQMSTPFRSERGVSIIMVTGREVAFHRDLEEVHDNIQNVIFRDRRSKAKKDFADNVRQKAEVEINWELLEKIPAPGIEPRGRNEGLTSPGKREKSVVVTPP